MLWKHPTLLGPLLSAGLKYWGALVHKWTIKTPQINGSPTLVFLESQKTDQYLSTDTHIHPLPISTDPLQGRVGTGAYPS